MSRIDGVHARSAGPLVGLLLHLARRQITRMTGRSPDRMIEPLEMYAHAPRLLIGYGMLEGATGKLNRVEKRLKALAELKAAALTNCEYCVDIGSQIARRAGITDDQLLALPNHRESELFSDIEKLVIDYTVAVSNTPVHVSDELFASLREQFDDGQVVELTNAIALENMRGRFNLALGIGAAGFTAGMVCAIPEPSAEETATSATAG